MNHAVIDHADMIAGMYFTCKDQMCKWNMGCGRNLQHRDFYYLKNVACHKSVGFLNSVIIGILPETVEDHLRERDLLELNSDLMWFQIMLIL